LLQIQYEEDLCQNLDNGDCRLAYYYIRAWAIERGLYRRKHIQGDSGSVDPAHILDGLTRVSYDQVLLSIPLYTQDADPKHSCSLSRILFQFFENFSSEFTSLDDRLLYYCPRAEDETYKWEGLLLKLRGLSIQRKLECPIYIRVNVVFAGSEIAGGIWLRDIVEVEVGKLSECIETEV
jgi:hypothetical protein